MATNIFYTNILKPLEEQLSDGTKIKTNVGKYVGNEAIRLVPIGQELIGQSNKSVNYQYNVLVSYKTSRSMDFRALTQKAADIIDVLNKTKLTIASTNFFDGQVSDVDYFPEVETDEDGNVISGADFNVIFACTTQELLS